ncbi:putative membrane protein [Mumia flava]|uniref:Putative membrane protein n=1 Tax=Mumia flava TaxID=1348852 RepID=A0A0B2B747_9ACTN|nr:DUF998 domain-containing protein [Mumia flava]PJJ57835.1 putative membrane protein [Mumia flava]
MTTTASTPTTATPCTPEQRITRSLLGYGIIAGPFYVTVSLVQAFTRDGFDPTTHAWSQLALGDLGWIQVVNLTLTGLMVLAFAIGLNRSLTDGPGSRWAPRLVGGFGVAMMVAAAFRADPSYGFPLGTPDGPGTFSTHGTIHLAAAAIGFTCLAAAGFVIARRYGAEGRQRAALASRVAAVVFFAGFVAMGASGGAAAGNLAFTAAVITVFGWLTALAVDQYRNTRAA